MGVKGQSPKVIETSTLIHIPVPLSPKPLSGSLHCVQPPILPTAYLIDLQRREGGDPSNTTGHNESKYDNNGGLTALVLDHIRQVGNPYCSNTKVIIIMYMYVLRFQIRANFRLLQLGQGCTTATTLSWTLLLNMGSCSS